MAPVQVHLSWNDKEGCKAINISNTFCDSMYDSAILTSWIHMNWVLSNKLIKVELPPWLKI